ncbi:helix-turn-helix transcriptional regulator [Alkalicella caledoniensis]|uniref:Helix-turn-helix transcriptional regulator n=1 Tax=Alkalicella caledoniensis TaxID=2731377 RepID=A0A7G9W8E0_ALKCA|nr:helix-turn-helix transcriptional regulator [Alkalicella caledoniensis]QNO14952.1 helix-turn-helix transcriptional regulator [Alkalicella caledoniensis]
MLDFSKKIKEEREKQRISMYSLAKKANCTSRAISYWETGQRIPNIEIADRVLKALGIKLVLGDDSQGGE